MVRILLAALLALGCVGLARGEEIRLSTLALPSPLPQPYKASANATADVAAAFARARANSKRVIVDFGANWCPDCRVLAGMFALPEFRAFIATHYEHVYVDVNRFDRNMDVVAKTGAGELKGIPTVLIFRADGRLLNETTSAEWTSASGRSPQEAMNYFAKWAR